MDVLHHPNPALKTNAATVDPTADGDLHSLVRRMAETMYEENGVGLAAPQVGVNKRVIVFDVDDRLAALVNPTIVESSQETEVDEEGCLSVPGITVPIARSVRVVCTGQTVDATDITIEAEGFLARVLQHEIDHLDGVLILDRCPAELKKETIRAYNEACGL